jgi:arginine deiminase
VARRRIAVRDGQDVPLGGDFDRISGTPGPHRADPLAPVRAGDAHAPGRLRVDPEHGRLRAVLVQRPGDELRAVAAGNARRMLFGGPVSVERAPGRRTTRSPMPFARGVEVLYVEQLLAEVVADPQLRTALIGRALAGSPGGRPPRRSGERPDGVLLGTPASAIRRREAAPIAAIYALHPRYSGRAAWTQGADPPIGVEGGAVPPAAPGRVAVGISPRTSAAAAHRRATTLLIR